MKDLFTSLDVWELVRIGYVELVATTNVTTAQHEELKKKKKKIPNAGVLKMIQVGVSQAIFSRITYESKNE